MIVDYKAKARLNFDKIPRLNANLVFASHLFSYL